MRKIFKKIDANKIKNVDGFTNQLINIINNKTVLLKTTVIVTLNCIISDLKVKSGMNDVYNFNDKDKLSKLSKIIHYIDNNMRWICLRLRWA